MSLFILIKKRQYIKLLEKYSKEKNYAKLNEMYLIYKRFCYENGLSDEIKYENLIGKQYILDVELEKSYSDDEEIVDAANKLIEVINSNKNGLIAGISISECETILKWVVDNAYDSISDSANIFSNSSSYFSQALMAFPFINVGVKCTINNVKYFNNNFKDHPFMTVIIPVENDGKVSNKQYLLDLTYKQFFTSENCNDGVFYDAKKRRADAGYYVFKTNEGVNFATKLLKNGYIELTSENAKIYGSSFECEQIDLDNYYLIDEISKKSGEEYINIINNKQESIAYSEDNSEFVGINLKFPTIKKVKKIEAKK